MDVCSIKGFGTKAERIDIIIIIIIGVMIYYANYDISLCSG